MHVVKPGMLTTIQDAGGGAVSRAACRWPGRWIPCSHRLANALVGNDRDAATLEVTLIGPELEFEDERLVAVAARSSTLTAGRPAACRRTRAFVVGAGSRLRFGARRRGARAYLAVAGGIAVPPVLAAARRISSARMGGLEGRALRAATACRSAS